jgi:phosphoadenosine phosphosulfate reductase
MNKEQRAIEFIQNIYKTINKPLYSGNSGGKDSAVLDYLLKKSGIKYNSIYTNTTIDPIGTIKHIRQLYPHTIILQPTETFYQLVERKGLPTRLNRYCCEYLKEYGSVGKVIFEGVRSAESRKRQGRDYIQCDTRKWQKGCQHIYPIYDWSDADVWRFIAEKQIKLAPCYSLGLSRLGCVGCPQINNRKRVKEFELYPKYLIQIKKSIKKGMDKNPQWQLSKYSKHDAELAIKWWLSGDTMKTFFPKQNQTEIEF